MNIRPYTVKLHRWCGLLMALFLINSGFTGATLAFREEIDRWLNADMLTVQASAPLPVERMVAVFSEQRPQARLLRFFAGADASEAWLFQVEEGGKAAPRAVDVWLDPGTGRITGERRDDERGLDRRHLMPTIWHWHDSLYMGKTGRTIIGTVALMWLLSSLLGIYLAVPRAGNLLKAFVIKRGVGTFKTVFDTHRVLGLVTCVVFLCSAFSATSLGLPNQFRGALNLFARTSESTLARLPKRPAAPPAVSMDQAIAIARGALPPGVFRGLNLYPAKGVYQVRMRLDGDINAGNGTGRVLIDMQSGAVLESVSFRNAGSAGDTLIAWLYPLHSGQAFGTAGRAVIAAIGIFPGVIALTGVWLWWRRRTLSARRATLSQNWRTP